MDPRTRTSTSHQHHGAPELGIRLNIPTRSRGAVRVFWGVRGSAWGVGMRNAWECVGSVNAMGCMGVRVRGESWGLGCSACLSLRLNKMGDGETTKKTSGFGFGTWHHWHHAPRTGRHHCLWDIAVTTATPACVRVQSRSWGGLEVGYFGY